MKISRAVRLVIDLEDGSEPFQVIPDDDGVVLLLSDMELPLSKDLLEELLRLADHNRDERIGGVPPMPERPVVHS